MHLWAGLYIGTTVVLSKQLYNPLFNGKINNSEKVYGHWSRVECRILS